MSLLYGDYSGPGIVATMPGSGLFRAPQEWSAEMSVNTGFQHICSCGRPA